MPRPKFLDQPYFSQRVPRTHQSRADYASPVTYHTTPWWRRIPDLAYAIGVVGACACIGLMLAWRG
jgi:hypothetical protein